MYFFDLNSYTAADTSKPHAVVKTKRVVSLLGHVIPANTEFVINFDSDVWESVLDRDGVSPFENEELFLFKKVDPPRDTSKVEVVKIEETPSESVVVEFEAVEETPKPRAARSNARKPKE